LAYAAPLDDLEFVAALRAGDEGALVSLMAEHGTTMLRVASLYVRDRAVAEPRAAAERQLAGAAWCAGRLGSARRGSWLGRGVTAVL